MSEVKLEFSEKDFAVVIRMGGVFDSNNFLDFQRRVRKTVDDGKYKMIFEMSDVRFLSSLIIGVLFATHITCKRNDGFVYLCGISHPEVKKMVSITRLDKILTVYETFDEAVSAAKSS